MAWSQIGNITGPPGTQGPQGPTGPASTVPGPQGPAGATGPPGPTTVSGDAGNTAMLGTDGKLYVPTLALATTTKIGALQKLSGNTTDFLDGTNTFQPLAPAVQPIIWSARLRAWNSLSNSTFEVDQRNGGGVGAVVTGANGYWDRWNTFTQTGIAISSQRLSSFVTVPGTTLPAICSTPLRITLTTTKGTLAASDVINIAQVIEGPMMRELITDVHSLQLLVRSSVANLSFGVSLRDSTTAHSLVKLCTIPTANTWTLINLPNLPTWVAGGSWNLSPGQMGYQLCIALASGSTFMTPANDAWQNGNFTGAAGQSNFAASPVNSTFDLAYVGHEPGALCTTPIDCPWQQNYDDCLRYYCKSYNYTTKAGSVQGSGPCTVISSANTQYPRGGIVFPKRMAKPPAVIAYNPSTGGANQCIRNDDGTAAGATAQNIGEAGFDVINLGAPFGTAGQSYGFHYTADTGW